MKFTDFYSDIRSYFAAHPEELKRFRKCDTVRKKLAFLVQNGMVRKKLMLLKKSIIPAKRARMPEYVPSAKRDWRKRSADLNPKSKQFPQLTFKAKVTRVVIRIHFICNFCPRYHFERLRDFARAASGTARGITQPFKTIYSARSCIYI